MTGDGPELRWSVYVQADVQPSGSVPNYGSGATPQEALDDLRSRWAKGHDEYQATLRALESAVASGPPLGSVV